MAEKDDYLLDLLCDLGFTSADVVTKAREEANAAGVGVVDLLVANKVIRPGDVTQAKAAQFGAEVVHLANMKIEDDVIARIIRVTDGMVKGIIAATMAVCLVYLVDIVLNMFGVHMPYIHESGKFGIILSLVIVGIASANLLIDFRVIEDRIESNSPRYMEWYCGMALLVTLVWLYLELLRLLSKMRSR